MIEGRAGRRRRRNAVLETLERFRRLDADLNAGAILAFLYICENEGLNIVELAQVCRFTEATASRAARRLAAPGAPGALRPSVGLVELRTNPLDSRGKLLFLTEAGVEFRDAIDILIEEAAPIVVPEPSAKARSHA